MAKCLLVSFNLRHRYRLTMLSLLLLEKEFIGCPLTVGSPLTPQDIVEQILSGFRKWVDGCAQL